MSGNSPCPVSLATDLTTPGATLHLQGDLDDLAAPMNHWAGAPMGRHALAPTVFHKGHRVVQEGHDLGPLLPHSPLNHPWVLAKSSRKPNWAASTVVADKVAVACSKSDSLPLMVCGDVNVPTSRNGSNATHTVFVGMTDVDVFRGYANVAVSMAVDIMSLPDSASPESLLASLPAELTGADPDKMQRQAVANLIASVAVSAYSGWEEPIGTKVEVNNPLMVSSKEVSYDLKTGKLTYKEQTNVAGQKTGGSVESTDVRVKPDAVGGPLAPTGGEWL